MRRPDATGHRLSLVGGRSPSGEPHQVKRGFRLDLLWIVVEKRGRCGKSTRADSDDLSIDAKR